ncbi:unnamed protein product, partial [Arabidopsis halleri]
RKTKKERKKENVFFFLYRRGKNKVKRRQRCGDVSILYDVIMMV